MSHSTDVKTMIFVNYQIEPIPAAFSRSLYLHLLENLWGDRSWVDEDIRVIVQDSKGESWICEIRYQFGECFSKHLVDEIGELIEKEIGIWAAKTNVYDIVAD